MKRDSRLAVALHVLLHLGERDEAITSEALGPMTRMNPVVVRRTIGHLRDAGIVRSVKGHGGGWSLARDLRDITIADVYDALGISPFHIGEREAEPTCLLERAVNHALRDALAEAEALLHEKMAAMTVAELAAIALRGHRRAHQKNQKNQKKARAHDHV